MQDRLEPELTPRGDRGRALGPGRHRPYGDARYEPLAHGAFRAECVRLGIELDVARALDDDECADNKCADQDDAGNGLA